MSSVSASTSVLKREESGLQAPCGMAAYFPIGAILGRLRRKPASHDRPVPPEDLARTAQLVGQKAHAVFRLEIERLAALPAPTILRLRSGSHQVYGGRSPSGDYRLVDPVTRSERVLPVGDLFGLTDSAVLVSRKLKGGGVDPQTFSSRGFLPSIWRCRRHWRRSSCKTGKRRILELLFSPLCVTVSRAMRER